MADESHPRRPDRNASETDATEIVADETLSDVTTAKEMTDDKTTTVMNKDETSDTIAGNVSEMKKDGGSATVAPRADIQYEWSLCGRTSTNVRLFVVVFAVTLLLRGVVQQYVLVVSRQLQRRYYIEENSLNFVFGVEKIAIVGTLLFVGYYGNAAHKPIATFCGAILCASGAFICAVPYFISGPLKQVDDAEDSLGNTSGSIIIF